MKKKIFSWLILAIFVVPCMVLFSACSKGDEVGYKVVINGKTFVSSVNTGVTIQYGTDVDLDVYTVFENGEQESLSASEFVITDESGVLTSLQPVGKYAVKFSHKTFGDIKVDVTVVPRVVAVPMFDVYTFTGETIVAEPNGFDASFMTISGNEGKVANDYEATISLKDTTNYVWEDNTTEAKNVEWTIETVKVEKPTLLLNEYVYNFEDQTVSISEYSTSLITVSGAQTGKNVGEYTVTFALKDKVNSSWAGETGEDETKDIVYTWNIVVKKYARPTIDASKNFVYDKSAKNAPVLGFDDQAMNYIAESCLTETNAGTYSVIVELDSTYAGNIAWAEAGDETVSLIWTISKKIVANPTAVSKTYTYSGSEQIFAINGLTDVMIVNGNKRTDAGTTEVAVSLVSTSNYEWKTPVDGNVVKFEWTINKKILTNPTAVNKIYTYTGSEQTFEMNGITDAMIVSGDKLTNAGSSEVAVSLNDANNYEWKTAVDGNVVKFTFVIQKAPAEAVAHKVLSGTYDPDKTLVDYVLDSNYVWVDSTIKPTCDVTQYAAKYNPDSSNYTDTTVFVTINVARATLVKPEFEAPDFTYDGTEKTIEYTGFDENTMTIANVSRTNAGTSIATVAIKDKVNYMWEDSTDADVTFEWEVKKAQAVAPVVEAMSGTYDPAKTLADYALPAGFAWVDPESTPTVPVNKYNAKYNPDSVNYLDASVEITLNIAKANPTVPTVEAMSGTYDPAKTLADYALPTGFVWVDEETLPTVAVNKYAATYIPSDIANYNVMSAEITINIAKANPTVPTVEAMSGTYDPAKTLANYALPTGFAWVDGETLPTVAVNKYAATYTPSDTANYNVMSVEITINIAKVLLTKPDWKTIRFSYNKSEQSIELNSYFDKDLMNISGNTGVNANDYTAIVSIKDKVNYAWADETNDDIEFDWVITKCKLTQPWAMPDGDEFTYNGEEHQVVLSETFDAEIMNVTGNKATDAGTYTAIISIKEECKANYTWIDFKGEPVEADVEVVWVINKAVVNRLSGTFETEWTSEEITFVPEDFDDTVFDISGNKETEINTYTATISLKDTKNYVFDDGTSSSTLEWAITKATPTLEFTKSLDKEYDGFGLNYPRFELNELYEAELIGQYGDVVCNFDYKNLDDEILYYASQITEVGIYKICMSFFETTHFKSFTVDKQFCIYQVADRNLVNFNLNSYQFEYTGDEIKPEFTLTFNMTGEPVDPSLYTVEYVDNVKYCSKGKIVIKFNAPYRGEIYEEFQILPVADEMLESVTVDGQVVTGDTAYVDTGKDTVTLTLKLAEAYKDAAGQFLVMGSNCYGGIAMTPTEIDNTTLTFTLSKNIAGFAVTYVENGVGADGCLCTLNIMPKEELQNATYIDMNFLSIGEHGMRENGSYNFIEIVEDNALGLKTILVNGLVGEENASRILAEGYTLSEGGIVLNVDETKLTITLTKEDAENIVLTYDIYDMRGVVSVQLDEVFVDSMGKPVYYSFNSSNELTIPKFITNGDTFNITISDRASVRDWKVYKGDKLFDEYDMDNGRLRHIEFGGITEAGKYTVRLFVDETIYVDYYVNIQAVDDTPAFEITYGGNKYSLNETMTGGILMNFGYDVYFYMYCGPVATSVTEITISIDSILTDIFDKDMQKFANLKAAKLQVLSSDEGKYCMIYIGFDGEVVPLYIYLYNEPAQSTSTNMVDFTIGDVEFGFDLDYTTTTENGFNRYWFGDLFTLYDPTEKLETQSVITLNKTINLSEMGDFMYGRDNTVTAKVKFYSQDVFIFTNMASVSSGVGAYTGKDAIELGVVKDGGVFDPTVDVRYMIDFMISVYDMETGLNHRFMVMLRINNDVD